MKSLVQVTAVGLLITSSQLACAADPDSTPIQKVGNKYSYTDKVATVKCSDWETFNLDQDGQIICKCGENLMYRTLPDMNLTKVDDGSGRVLVSFEPAFKDFVHPLETGKSWAGSYRGFTADNNTKWDSTYKCEVKAFENVTTGAGVFDAFRVDCEDKWSSGTYSGVGHTSRWYAPALNEVVKVSHKEDPRWNQELKGYQLVP